MKKNTTPRCEYCSYLIFSKKKIKHNRKIYHLSCYKRMTFDTLFLEEEYKNENGKKEIYGIATRTGEAIQANN
jgi:DNA-directed RNA polymerase subunit RPC12/RpoP